MLAEFLFSLCMVYSTLGLEPNNRSVLNSRWVSGGQAFAGVQGRQINVGDGGLYALLSNN